MELLGEKITVQEIGGVQDAREELSRCFGRDMSLAVEANHKTTKLTMLGGGDAIVIHFPVHVTDYLQRTVAAAELLTYAEDELAQTEELFIGGELAAYEDPQLRTSLRLFGEALQLMEPALITGATPADVAAFRAKLDDARAALEEQPEPVVEEEVLQADDSAPQSTPTSAAGYFIAPPPEESLTD